MTGLRVGIDGYNLAIPKGSGVATYGHVLATSLRGAGHCTDGIFGIPVGSDPELREILFFERFANGVPAAKRPARSFPAISHFRSRRTTIIDEVALTGSVNIEFLEDRLPHFDRIFTGANLFDVANRRFKQSRRFTSISVPNPPDIMHWTYPLPIYLEGACNIYTLHDLVPLKLPFTTLDDKSWYKDLIAGCASRGRHICTVSEASKSDIIRETDIDPDRITNCYQASPISQEPHGIETSIQSNATMGMFGLPAQGYFLFAGAAEPKKNLGRLLEAYLGLELDTPLVLVLGRSWQSEAELRLLDIDPATRPAFAEAMGRRVIRLDHLPRRTLLQLIRDARAVLLPSIYEGFGLPALEAMELGVPVLAGDCAALREITDGAALLANPYDVNAISRALRQLDSDGALRRRLSEAGRNRASDFSRSAYVSRLEEMYRKALSSGP